MALDSVNKQLFIPAYGNGGFRAFQLTAEGLPQDRRARFVTSRQSLLGRRAAPLPSAREATFPGAAGLFDNSTQRFFAIDRFANRILVYDATQDRLREFPEASIAIGQPDFRSTRRGLGPNRTAAIVAADIDEEGQRLFVVDAPNNRILVFDITPGALTHDPRAVAVIGQNDLESRDAGLGPSRMTRPTSVAYDPEFKRLFVSDSGNNRVLIFDADPANANGFDTAIAVMGQADFNSRNPRQSLDQLEAETLAYDSKHHRLFIAEDLEHRVMVYDAHPDRVGGPARALAVIGQPDAFSTHPAVARDRVAMPRITVDSETQKLYVSEGYPAGNRIAIFDIAPENLRTGMPASDVIGHQTPAGEPDFDNRMAQGHLDARSLAAAREVVLDPVDHRLFVADQYNHRVVIWQLDNLNRIVDRDARWVLGQPDINTSLMGPPSARNMTVPIAAAYDTATKRLFVGDGYHNRILVYDAAPETLASGMAASVVIGQRDFESVVRGAGRDQINFGVRMGRGIASDFLPMGLAVDAAGQRLFVSDGENNRVLVFDIRRRVLANGPSATHVLGQDDFDTVSPQMGAAGLHDPGHLAYDPTTDRLFVIDGRRKRVVAFDVDAEHLRDGAAAIAVIGKPNFDTPPAQAGAGPLAPPSGGPPPITGSAFVTPNGIAHDPLRQRLFVSDGGGTFGVPADRILVFDVDPKRLVNGATAIATLGAPNAEARAAQSWGGAEPIPGQFRVRDTRGIELDAVNGRLFATGSFESRIVQFNFPRAVWDYAIDRAALQSFATLDAADLGGSSDPITTGAAYLEVGAGAAPLATIVYSATRQTLDQTSQRHSRLLISEAAVGPSAPTRQATVHIDARAGSRHDVHIVNPADRDSELLLTLRDRRGSTTGQWERTVGPGRKLDIDVEQLTDALTADSSLTLEATVAVAVTALRVFNNDRGEQLLVAAPLAVGPAAAGQSVAPYFVSGGGLRSELVLVNPTDDLMRGTVSLHASDGLASALGTESEIIDYLVAPHSSRVIESNGSGATPQQGYLRIAATDGGQPFAYIALERRYGGALAGATTLSSVVAGEVSFAIDLQPTLIRHGESDVQVIVVNTNTAEARLGIALNDEPIDTHTIAPGRQYVASVRDLAGANARGRLTITSSAPVAVAARQKTLNVHSEYIDVGLPALTGAAIVPLVRNGQGVSTEFRLANAGSRAISGTLRFVTATGEPAVATILR